MFTFIILVFAVLTSQYCIFTYGSRNHDVFFKNLDIYSYRHFDSLQTIYFEIPPDARFFSWNLTINKSRPACEDFVFYLYLQQGSFPIDNFDGPNTFPKTYRIDRTGFMKNNLTSQKTIVVEQPFYGQWFLGALMEQNVNQVVKKISSLWCEYNLVGNLTYGTEDVDYVNPGKVLDINVASEYSYFKFTIGPRVFKYSISLESNCDFSVTTRSAALPGPDSPVHDVVCNRSTSACKLEFEVYNPEVDKWQYLRLHRKGCELLNAKLNVTLFECESGPLRNITTNNYTCYLSSPLTPTVSPKEPYSSTYGVSFDSNESVLVPRPFVSMTTLAVDKIKDIGGTLNFGLEVTPISVEFSKNYDIHVCIQRGISPISAGGRLACKDDNTIRLNFSSSRAVVHFPYPEPGLYFIAHQDFNQTRSRMNLSELTLGLFVTASVGACEEGKCQNGGKCRSSLKGSFIMSYCYCVAGTKGISCAETSDMPPKKMQMTYTLFLCLSNLAFIPAIIISFMRWRYTECLIYFTNMICSTFYHACDMSQWSVYGLCILNYGIHQFSDFYLSLLSFWVTLLAMSRIRSGYMVTGLVMGVIFIALLVEGKPSKLLSNVIPIFIGIVTVLASWAWQMYKSKTIYPPKREYRFIIPGLLLAMIGIIVFAFFETDVNYPITHSMWHILMGFCIPLLLPRERVVWELNTITQSKSSMLIEFNDDDEGEGVMVQSSPVQMRQYPHHPVGLIDDHHSAIPS